MTIEVGIGNRSIYLSRRILKLNCRMKTDIHENLAAGGRWEGGASAETWLKCLLCSGWIGVEILRAVLERVIRITPRRLSQHFKLNTHHNPHLIAITYHIGHRNKCMRMFLQICKTHRQSTKQMPRNLKMYMVGILAQTRSFESLSCLQLIESWVCCVFCLFPIFPARLYMQ